MTYENTVADPSRYERPERPSSSRYQSLSDYGPADYDGRNGSRSFRAAPLAKQGSRGDQQTSVDQVVMNGYMPICHTEPIGGILGDGKTASWMQVDDLICQIRSRYEIYSLHMYGLLREEILTRNAAMNWHRPPGWTPMEDPDVLRSVQALESQRRQERTGLWRDVSQLRQSLPQLAREYLSAHRRSEILRDGDDQT